MRLLSLHNLRFLIRLTETARTAIEQGRLASTKAEALARLQEVREPAWKS
jgi:tRNA-guanine family transglycosylase